MMPLVYNITVVSGRNPETLILTCDYLHADQVMSWDIYFTSKF